MESQCTQPQKKFQTVIQFAALFDPEFQVPEQRAEKNDFQNHSENHTAGRIRAVQFGLFDPGK